jgi:predicted nucleic-acid-binding protein
MIGLDTNVLVRNLTQDDMALLRTKCLAVEHADVVWQALRRFADVNTDFADCLIERCNHAAGCDYTATFDRNAAKSAGMHILN